MMTAANFRLLARPVRSWPGVVWRASLWTAFVSIALGPIPSRAGGLESLEEFIRNVRSGQAEFTQVVSSPARPGQAQRSKTSSGEFAFARPGRFRFSYQKPFEQTIVADGQTLWLFDPDLNQVTARSQAQALGATPAALIASAASLKDLQADFALTDAPVQDGLEWVHATPRVRDGSLQSVRVGLLRDGAQVRLQALEIVDSFGQHSVLRFKDFQVNPSLTPGVFVFTPPAGADVVRP